MVVNGRWGQRRALMVPEPVIGIRHAVPEA